MDKFVIKKNSSMQIKIQFLGGGPSEKKRIFFFISLSENLQENPKCDAEKENNKFYLYKYTECVLY